jgi:DUF1365 family protein
MSGLSSLRSALYQGRVRHTRLHPLHHDFEYRIYYAMFDLGELEELARDLRFFSIGRPNLYGFDPADHGVEKVGDLRPWVEATLARAGVNLEGGRVSLLTLPSVLGYVFNPISVWYCYGPGDELRAVIHEVRNTFGDRHIYVAPIGASSDLRHAVEKRLHVSPFNDMDQTYHFTMTRPGDHLSLAIEQTDSEGTMFRAGLRLRRLPMNDLNLLKLFLAHPLVTLHVIVGIHWQALRLWLKGANYRKRPEPAKDTVTIVGRAAVPT